MNTARSQILSLGLIAFAVIHGLPETSLAQSPIVIANPTVIDATDTTFDGQDIVVSNCSLTVSGAHDFNSLTLVSNAILTHAAAPNGETNNRVDLTITENALVDGTSQILADGLGYSAGAGPGAGIAGNASASGGYGGMGGTRDSGGGGAAYGSVAQPVDFGSGGSDAGANGGGAIELVVAGTLEVDGLISANGLTAGNSGGSGGSIWLEATNISGNGTIEANGGNGNNNSAGGGRIALDYQTSTFTGTTTAWGGAGAGGQDGGAGTIFIQKQSSPLALIVLDNHGNTGAWTPADLMEGTNFVVTVTNGALVAIQGGETWFVNQLTVATNSTIDCYGTNTIGTNGVGVSIVAQSIVLDAGAAVDADGQGYIDDSGPGAGITGNAETGGGYGGAGGKAFSGGGGGTYGSLIQPVDLGSAGSGNGASGGGGIKMVAAGTLQMDGLISVGGLTSTSSDSGGAGGSVWLQAGIFSGTGIIQANGSYGFYNGGGGGRIAVDYQTNTFTGTTTAWGGQSGGQGGGAGTVCFKAQTSMLASILIDNNGNTGGFTPADLIDGPDFEVTVTNGSEVTIQGGETWTVNQLTVASNCVIECFSTNTIGTSGAGVIIVAQSIVIDTGATVDADGQGYIDDSGPGAGITGNAETGGGYGGHGGTAFGGGGGGTYGSATQPVDLGSAGSGNGAFGGGAIKMVAAGTLQMDGLISVGGLTSTSSDSGGAGGSVWLQAGIFSGTGTVQANGGYGFFNGGGGGRIAVDYQASTFTGTIIASGGGAGNSGAGGGAGTVVLQPVVVLSNSIWLGNVGFQFQFNTFNGTNYAVQYSTNLVDWTPWIQVTGTGAPATITDPTATVPCRFYRVRFSDQ